LEMLGVCARRHRLGRTLPHGRRGG
jgi:hypothetical protein